MWSFLVIEANHFQNCLIARSTHVSLFTKLASIFVCCSVNLIVARKAAAVADSRTSAQFAVLSSRHRPGVTNTCTRTALQLTRRLLPMSRCRSSVDSAVRTVTVGHTWAYIYQHSINLSSSAVSVLRSSPVHSDLLATWTSIRTQRPQRQAMSQVSRCGLRHVQHVQPNRGPYIKRTLVHQTMSDSNATF